jgi:hypothetical protein
MGCPRTLQRAALFFCLFRFALSLPTISIVGSKFYDSDGNQFFIKGTCLQALISQFGNAASQSTFRFSLVLIHEIGVRYQPGGLAISYDPLSATAQCTEDVRTFKTAFGQD